MSKKCDICGKKPVFGHRISHAHNVNKRRWNPNIQRIRILADGRKRRANVCTSCISAGKVVKAG